jgi:carbon storage regulator CsrA
MLVLTRGIGELTLVGDEIQLKVIDVEADRVRIGIKAPRHMYMPLIRSPAQAKPPIQSPRRP